MKYLKLIFSAILIVLLLSLIFYFLVYNYIYLENSNKIREVPLTLTMYFFTGISTLGAVLSAIYTLHIQSIAKRPNITLETTNLTSKYYDFIEKNNFSIGLKMLNTGENAFFLKLTLRETCVKTSGITYSFDKFPHEFDIYKSINEIEKPHYMEVCFNSHPSEASSKIDKISPLITLTYQDQNHDFHIKKYLIKYMEKRNNIPFFKLEKVGFFRNLMILISLFLRRFFN